MAQKFKFDMCADTTNVCGCPSCLIASDKFNRTNETPLASPWTKLSGTDANLSSNVLDLSAAAFYRHNTGYATATASRHAKVKFKLASTGSTYVELCIGITDVDNYFTARVNIPASGCPVIWAAAVTAGVLDSGISSDPGADVILEGLDQGIAIINAPELTEDEWHTLEVCLLPNTGSYGYTSYDELRIKLTLADGTIYATRWWVDGPAIGDYAGVKATGAAQFDDFEYTYFRNSPTDEHRSCPNCNTPCFIGSDDFATDVPCNWHQYSGSAYSISGGLMNVAASSLVAFALPHPMYKTSCIVEVDLYWDIGIIARVALGTGTNGAGYVLFDATALEMQLYDNTDTLLDSVSLPAVDSAAYAVTLCYDGQNGILTATAFGECATGQSSGTVTNPFAFLGAEAGNAPRFDNFVFKKHYDAEEPSDGGCDDCECQVACDVCTNGTAPELFKVVLSGITSGGAGCLSCELIDGTWIVEGDADCEWSAGSAVLQNICTFGAGSTTIGVQMRGPGDTFPGDPTTVTEYTVRVVVGGLLVSSGDGVISLIWQKEYGTTKPDCDNFLNESIPFLRNDSTDNCDGADPGPALLTTL